MSLVATGSPKFMILLYQLKPSLSQIISRAQVLKRTRKQASKSHAFLKETTIYQMQNLPTISIAPPVFDRRANLKR